MSGERFELRIEVRHSDDDNMMHAVIKIDGDVIELSTFPSKACEACPVAFKAWKEMLKVLVDEMVKDIFGDRVKLLSSMEHNSWEGN